MAATETTVSPPRSSARTEARRRLADPLLIGALVLAGAVIYSIYAVKVGSFQRDEELYLSEARNIAAHFPGALWQSGVYQRGLQRLDPLILAFTFAILRGPGAYQLGHVLQSTLFASTAIPVFLWGKAARLGRWAALLAATLAIAVPWAVTATSFLSESAAYPAFAWALYAIWAAAHRPSLGHDALALLALAIAGLSRSALLALIPALPLAVLWAEWYRRPREGPWRRRLSQLGRQLWAGHKLLVVVLAVSIVVVAGQKVGTLPGDAVATATGTYGLPKGIGFADLLDRYHDYVSRIAVGTGYLAAALGAAWTAMTLVRPREERSRTLAVVCLLGLAAVFLSVLKAGLDERYFLYASVPVALAGSAALSAWARAPRLSLPAMLGPILGAIAVAVLAATATWPALATTYDYFTYPAGMFYQRVLIGKASAVHVLGVSATRLIEVTVVLIVVVSVVASRVLSIHRLMVAVLGTGLAVFAIAQTDWALRKYTSTAGAASGPSAAKRSWVDRHVPGGAVVGALAISDGETDDYTPVWRETQFWNTSVKVNAYFEPGGVLPVPFDDPSRKLAADSRTGLLAASLDGRTWSRALVPRYMLVPLQDTNSIGLDDTRVTVSNYLPLELVRLNQPARLAWKLSGTDLHGFIGRRQSMVATVYPGGSTGPSPRCASFSLIAPPGFAGRRPYAVTVGLQTPIHGSFTAGQTLPLVVHLPTPTGKPTQFVVRVGAAVRLPTGETVAGLISAFAVGRCTT